MKIVNNPNHQAYRINFYSPKAGINSPSPLQAPQDHFTRFSAAPAAPEPAKKASSFWKSPGVKVLGGGLLLAAGISIKVFGLATMIGAPVLLPVGIGIAIAGTGLAIWGIAQACKSEPTPETPVQPKEPKYKGRAVSAMESHLLLQLVQDLIHPDDGMMLSAFEKLKELGLTDKDLNELHAVFGEYAKNKQLMPKAKELFLKAKNHIRDYNSEKEVLDKAIEQRLKGNPYWQGPSDSDFPTDPNWAVWPAIALATEQNNTHDSGTITHHGHHGVDPGGFDFGLS